MNGAAALRLVVLISGEGTNLQAIIDAIATGALGARVVAVISNRADAPGLERARRAGIPALALVPADFADRSAYDRGLLDELRKLAPDLVVLAGFMRILSPPLVAAFRGRMLNIHPSLLPRHRGLNALERAVAAGDRWHGATVHYVTEELDGGPAVLQYRLPLSDGDSLERVAARIHAGEHLIYPLAISWIAEGRLRWTGSGPELDGRPLQSPRVIEEPAERRGAR